MAQQKYKITYRPHLVQNSSAFPEQKQGTASQGKVIQPRQRDGKEPKPDRNASVFGG